MGYGRRAVALTELPAPNWQQVLADMNRHTELFAGRDPEVYRFRAWIHENLGDHAESNRDHRMAEYHGSGDGRAKPHCVCHPQTRHANGEGDDAS